MANTAFIHVQELCQLIVDLLQDSKADLESCALISPAFTAAAQRHLFRDVNLTANGDGLPDRFCAILAIAPHILQLVRRVQTGLEAQVLTQLSKLHFPNLRELCFTGNTSPSGLQLAADLVGLPSICSVTLDHCFLSIADVTRLFESCTSRLDSLTLDSSTIREDAEGAGPNGPRTRRIKLNRLGIQDIWISWEWLLHPMCSFDIAAIHDLDYNSLALFSPPATILNSSRWTLKKLSISVSIPLDHPSRRSHIYLYCENKGVWREGKGKRYISAYYMTSIL
ncbi:hypothetical protein C8F04DRAFT_1266572 [Mycena alexandri]|uniref:Uncharacterized protein n=1 Tax=Mycena alexandri TaxID=1745969 RepID=A0AAD6WWG1_9AGAR|nr:hypothetical protein C8F04DRAFT_1266572 [Mycena alexandri]